MEEATRQSLLIRKLGYFQIDVANRDYHYLSQSEIAGGKRNFNNIYPDRNNLGHSSERRFRLPYHSSTDRAGTCPGGQFVVSATGEAYDAQAGCLS
jgi:hypothetical protein